MEASGGSRSMKTIMHLDMNSYFATVEQQANPQLRGRPLGIIKAEGRGCVIAASIEAKKYGVKTGTTVWEAKSKCPQIVLVPADMDKYLGITKKFISIVNDYSPIVEVFSIDEMFVDVSQTQDLYSGGAYQMAIEIKNRVRNELGDWIRCSVGVSFTKLLAKLASELKKPDGLVFLNKENYLQKTEGVDVGEVCGIGQARTKWLNARGAYNLGQARKLDINNQDLRKLVWLETDLAMTTIDDLSPAKSVSRTFTTYRKYWSEEEILALIRNLIEEAAGKLREMGMVGRMCALSLDGFWSRTTMRQASDDPEIFFKILGSEYKKRPVVGIRKAGVWISNLEFNIQYPMFNERRNLLRAVDQVNTRWGLFTLYPGSLFGRELIRPEVTGFLGDKWYRLRN